MLALLFGLLAPPCFSLPPVIIDCQGPCSPARENRVREELARLLGSMPDFLRGAEPESITWHDQEPGTSRGGEKDGARIELWVPRSADMSDILCHELAHLLQDRQPEVAQDFLSLRHDTPDFREKAARIWLEVMRANNGELEPPYRLDAGARQAMAALRYPRRSPHDLHALTRSTEYWAVSVEMARKDLAGLARFLSDEEVATLARLFRKEASSS